MDKQEPVPQMEVSQKNIKKKLWKWSYKPVCFAKNNALSELSMSNDLISKMTFMFY